MLQTEQRETGWNDLFWLAALPDYRLVKPAGETDAAGRLAILETSFGVDYTRAQAIRRLGPG